MMPHGGSDQFSVFGVQSIAAASGHGMGFGSVDRRMTCRCQSLVVDFFELLALLKVGAHRDPTRVKACFEIGRRCDRMADTEG